MISSVRLAHSSSLQFVLSCNSCSELDTNWKSGNIPPRQRRRTSFLPTAALSSWRVRIQSMPISSRTNLHCFKPWKRQSQSIANSRIFWEGQEWGRGEKIHACVQIKRRRGMIKNREPRQCLMEGKKFNINNRAFSIRWKVSKMNCCTFLFSAS